MKDPAATESFGRNSFLAMKQQSLGPATMTWVAFRGTSRSQRFLSQPPMHPGLGGVQPGRFEARRLPFFAARSRAQLLANCCCLPRFLLIVGHGEGEPAKQGQVPLANTASSYHPSTPHRDPHLVFGPYPLPNGGGTWGGVALGNYPIYIWQTIRSSCICSAIFACARKSDSSVFRICMHRLARSKIPLVLVQGPYRVVLGYSVFLEGL